MKTISNPKTTVSEDGKTVTIVATIEDVPFSENIITRVTHPHTDLVAGHVRHVQSSNAAVFIRHRGHSVVFQNEMLIAIAAAIEPATSFPPHFKHGEKPEIHSELPASYQWQVSDNAFPVADKPHTPPPPAVWKDIPLQTAASISSDAPVKPGQWIRLMVSNAAGKSISKPIKVK